MNRSEIEVISVGVVCVAVFGWWLLCLPVGAVVVEHPTPVYVEYVSDYRIVAYIEGPVDVEGCAGQVCFSPTLGEFIAYRFFGWRVWEPLD